MASQAIFVLVWQSWENVFSPFLPFLVKYKAVLLKRFRTLIVLIFEVGQRKLISSELERCRWVLVRISHWYMTHEELLMRYRAISHNRSSTSLTDILLYIWTENSLYNIGFFEEFLGQYTSVCLSVCIERLVLSFITRSL